MVFTLFSCYILNGYVSNYLIPSVLPLSPGRLQYLLYDPLRKHSLTQKSLRA